MYGEKNYPQKLGNGNYTIAQAGCLLTAFCNLLTRFGVGIDPPSLNTYFINNGDYIKDSDGANEDLSWNSVTKYNSNVVPTSTGSTSMPPSANSIVKFHYNSVETGQPIDHFCLVDHIDGTSVYIVDSWDGVVKSPATYEPTYHTIIGWASYAMNVPVPSTPLPAAPVTAPDTTTKYTVVTNIPGYMTATQAVSKSPVAATVPAGSYYIFNQNYGMINVTKTPGNPGSWINPSQNVVPIAPTPTSAPTETYDVIKTLQGYPTSNDAANHLGDSVVVPTGIYTIFNQASGMINVTTKPGTAGDWINPADNVPSTPVETVVTTLASDPTPVVNTPVPNFNGWKSMTPLDPSPQKYVVLKAYTAKEYGGNGRSIPLKVGQELGIYGTFVFTDDVIYGRPKLATDPNLALWYGVRMPTSDDDPNAIMQLESIVYSTKTDISTRVVTDLKTFDDRITLFFAWVERIADKLTLSKK